MGAADATPGLSTYEKKKRKEHLENLTKTHADITAIGAKTLGKLKREAEHNSARTLWTGGVGIAAGIAAGALVVASPANVVWVTALTGIGAGTLSFQTRAALEGMSREAVARVYNDTLTKLTLYETQFEASYELLWANQTIYLPGIWDAEAAKAEVSLEKYRSAAMLVSLPSATEDATAIMQRQVELMEQFVQMRENIKKLTEGK